MRIRFHAAGSDRPKHRVGELLRKRSDALGRQDQACALGKSLDAFSGFAPERVEIPLSLDSAPGHRSVRPQHGLLRLPSRFQNNMQDGPNMRGPSIAPPLEYGRVVDTGWERRMGGCESGFTLPDPTDPSIVWASCYGNEVTRWDAKTKRVTSFP